ncbi:MFS transporter [Brevibacillus daliensis]|uniref:MFS transporter n=1 Tax=Brevibacillus daliensis TaxID=2892995 RepID=UPI001E359FBE|nr:MFS transporter [Brevibacillus daliensis]
MESIYRDKRLYLLLLANISSSIGIGITSIALPWLLLQKSGGEVIMGYQMLAGTLLLFFISPYMGIVIDRYSRKSLILLSDVFSFVILLPLSVIAIISGQLSTSILVLMMFVPSIYYSIQYPAQMAFCQEIFNRDQYYQLNSALEVQGQTASMISAGIAALLVGKIDIGYILAINLITHVIGYVAVKVIPYQQKKDLEVSTSGRIGIKTEFSEGYTYLRQHKKMFFFMLCSMFPFIVIMMDNYLAPVYVYQTLMEGAHIYGIYSIVYAVGAILGGIMIPILLKKVSMFQTTVIMLSIFIVGLLGIVSVQTTYVFITMSLLLGLGNAGSRVTRKTMMMHVIPYTLMGRVNGFLNTSGLVLRSLLLLGFTNTISFTGAIFSYTLLTMFMLGGLAIIISTRSIFKKEEMPST